MQGLSTQNPPRQSALGVYLYPVLSRRAGGLSLGINLNQDQRCSFRCRYCQVDRSRQPRPQRPNLGQLEQELEHFFSQPGAFDLATLKDIALAGDGEPSLLACLPQALRLLEEVKTRHGIKVKTVLFTNGTGLGTPRNQAALSRLLQGGGEVWFKLDFWDKASYHWLNQGRASRQKILSNLLALGRRFPLVLQTCALRDERGKGTFQPAPYLAQLKDLLSQGLQVKKLQLYTLARQPAEPEMHPLADAELDAHAHCLRQELGFTVETYYQK